MATQPRARSKSRRRSSIAEAAESIVHGDLNMAAAALLYDMAALQPTERSQFGYKRAAKVVIGLPVSVADLVVAGTLRDVEYIGPASARIITELVEQGQSASVDAAIAKSMNPSHVTSRREFRGAYLSHFAMQQALAAPLGKDVIARRDYRGDFQMHSTWSDGGETIATLVSACLELGHTCLGITDHSYGLPIARGISMADAEKYVDLFDPLRASGFKLPNDLGVLLTMKIADAQQGMKSGFFYAINLGTASEGSSGYRSAIGSCPDLPLAHWEDFLQPLTGNLKGPTVQGVADLINLDPNAEWDPVTN